MSELRQEGTDVVNEAKIYDRLQRLEQAIVKLERIRQAGWERFRRDTDLQVIADRNQQSRLPL